VLVWLSVWSEVQIVCMWSSWCHCHPKTPSSLASFKSGLVLPFWQRLTQVVLEKRPLNGCSSDYTVSGSGICKSAPGSRQIAAPATHHSVFYRPNVLPVAPPTAWHTPGFVQQASRTGQLSCSACLLNKAWCVSLTLLVFWLALFSRCDYSNSIPRGKW